VFRPDSVQLLTAKKKESIAVRFPKHPKIKKAISEQPMM
jgi:tRNA A37 threonylcarbamoyladenosine synthetase subunit TsaC/SUA5/YrdC